MAKAGIDCLKTELKSIAGSHETIPPKVTNLIHLYKKQKAKMVEIAKIESVLSELSLRYLL